jgi:TolB protein
MMSMRRIRLMGLLLGLMALPAQAALEVNVREGVRAALSIALVPFGGTDQFDVSLTEIASQDLATTGLFKPLARDRMLGQPSRVEQINYANWRTTEVDNIVVGSVAPDGNGNYRITFKIVDVYKESTVGSYQVFAKSNDLRSAAHMVANLVYEQFIGKKGYFLSRLAYVTARNEGGTPRYRLMVSDYDGQNPRVIQSSRDPILSPAWAPNGSQLAYVAFDVDRGRTVLRTHDLNTGDIREVSARQGINGAPAWSPDGSKLAMTLSFRGNPEIYTYDLGSKKLSQVTFHGAIDTEPAWSPDGQYIVFTSDRGGKPQVYRMRATGGQVERMTFSGESNQRASFGPDGDKMTLVQGGDGGFRIAVLDLNTNNTRIVSRGPLDESPSFAPNGQAIIYAKSGRGGANLAVVSSDGEVRSELAQSGDVREPAWSPAGY